MEILYYYVYGYVIFMDMLCYGYVIVLSALFSLFAFICTMVICQMSETLYSDWSIQGKWVIIGWVY